MGNADDFGDANGGTLLGFREAREKARALGRQAAGDTGVTKPVTVAEAFEADESDLETRRADTANVGRVRFHSTMALLEKSVPLRARREV
jgi:hypothetical protein